VGKIQMGKSYEKTLKPELLKKKIFWLETSFIAMPTPNFKLRLHRFKRQDGEAKILARNSLKRSMQKPAKLPPIS
jgi:hypothetical protein